MRSEGAQIRFMLDEHYPGWLAEDLATDGIDAVALTAHRPALRGVDDKRVLEAASFLARDRDWSDSARPSSH
jgi:hypothetical protein